jgi:translocation and assembly module TamA
MKKIIWSLYLLSAASPAGAAFFQTADDKAKEQDASPVKVNVQGADEALTNNLKAFLPSLRNLKCDASRERVQRFIESSNEKLAEGAEAMGYYAAQFQVTPARQANCLVLNVAVKPGNPVRVKQVQIEVTGAGKTLPEFQSILATPPYRAGDVLVHQPYEDFKTNLTRTANNLGFFDAKYLNREIQVDPDKLEAVVHIAFDTGKRYQVGKVSVTQDVLDDKHLRHYVRVQQGDTYNLENLLKQQRILEGSGYYSDVQVRGQYQHLENGDAVPVEIVAQRRKRYTYTGKLGYGSDTGARAETGMEVHWMNRRGHQLTTKGKIGQKEQSVEATYKVPLWNPENEYTSFSAGWQKSDNNDIKSNGMKVGVDYNRRSDDDWQQTIFINYLDETTQVTGEDEIRSQLALLGGRVKKTKTNDLLFPSEGWQVLAEVQGGRKGLLSDQNILQGKVQGKYLYSFDNQGKVIAQGALGSTLTDEFDAVPKSLRFFAGGQNSVRGYDFESLGEKNTAGEVVGGKHLLTSSLEYEHPVADKISAAAFVDAGNAFDNTANLTMKVGAGVGVRYKSPLGPIRVDVAVPTDKQRDVHFYFSLGPDL